MRALAHRGTLGPMPGARTPLAPGLAEVYGAALAAAQDAQAAADVAVEVLTDAPRPLPGIEALRVATVILALRRAPARAFAAVPPGEREALGLARLLGLNVTEIAEALSIDRATAAARLTAALRALACDPVPA
jgi:DNA-directed RNA polymerase specialized sigma24 family protein